MTGWDKEGNVICINLTKYRESLRKRAESSVRPSVFAIMICVFLGQVSGKRGRPMGKKIIIIGGGIAGLSAGCYARMNGYDAEIFEAHDAPGGQCTARTRKGYRFDTCIHWLLGTSHGVFHDIWKETGSLNDDVRTISHEIFCRVSMPGGEEFLVYSDIDRWAAYMMELAPDDRVPIDKMRWDIRKLMGQKPFADAPGTRGMGSYLRAMRDMGPVMRQMTKYYRMSYDEYIKNLYFSSPRLKWALHHCLYAGTDVSALAFMMLFANFKERNAAYPQGGSLLFAKRMAERFTELGGVLHLGQGVEAIMVEKGRAAGVRLMDGDEYRADVIISAADLRTTLYDLLGGRYVSAKMERAFAQWPLYKPLVQVSCGVRRTFDEWITPLTQVVAPGEQIGSTVLKQGYSIFNYAFDRTMAPAGKTAMILRCESPYDLWEGMSDTIYKKEKKQIRQDAVRLLEREYPGIGDDIDICDVATPLTTIRNTGVYRGAYEGFLPTGRNIRTSLPMKLPGLKDFYLAGQWLFPGGGLPPAAQSGKWAIQKQCKADRREFRAWAG